MTPDTLLGTITRSGDDAEVVFDRVYDTDAADLWETLTDPERLARWFARVDGDLREGGRFTIHFDDDDVPECRITSCDAPRGYRLGVVARHAYLARHRRRRTRQRGRPTAPHAYPALVEQRGGLRRRVGRLPAPAGRARRRTRGPGQVVRGLGQRPRGVCRAARLAGGQTPLRLELEDPRGGRVDLGGERGVGLRPVAQRAGHRRDGEG